MRHLIDMYWFSIAIGNVLKKAFIQLGLSNLGEGGGVSIMCFFSCRFQRMVCFESEHPLPMA